MERLRLDVNVLCPPKNILEYIGVGGYFSSDL
jgi:hypothetical protein